MKTKFNYWGEDEDPYEDDDEDMNNADLIYGFGDN